MISGEAVTFSVGNQSHNISSLTIKIDKSVVNTLYNHTLLFYQNKAKVAGFAPGATPVSYLEYSFRPTILEHLKDVLFNHYVIHNLYTGIVNNSLITIGDPSLHTVNINPPHEDAFFSFECYTTNPQPQEDWKKLIFKAPQRKNYKDLDRQVELFMKEEEEKSAQYQEEGINFHDLVCFNVELVDSNQKPLFPDYKTTLWLRISDEEIDHNIQALFLGKRKGDSFITTQPFFHEHTTTEIDLPYLFKITVQDYLSHTFFSLSHFKHHFKIKVPKDVHHKLIEVFSYRHDISQRRETVEASLKLLLNNHYLVIPDQLIKRQIEMVLDDVRDNPDYHVYKAQPDFKNKVKLLAEKQLKEKVLIDYIMAQERIPLENEDIVSYLNFMKRPRTKEFVYFNVPFAKVKEKETPISSEILKQACLREKTLNHILGCLTRK